MNINPSSLPFISGDTFKLVCDSIYDFDTRNNYNFSYTKSNSIVFVNTDLLEEFYQLRIAYMIENLIIICHNSDRSFDQGLLDKFSNYNDYYFSTNVTAKSSKLIPIPIGLENLKLYLNGVTSRYTKLTTNSPQKPAVYSNFSLDSNYSTRKRIYDFMCGYKFAKISERLPILDYIDEIRDYMFVISPPGNGIDCHRTWEAIAMNVIPICISSPVTDHFHSLGLPIVLISNIEELNKYNTLDSLRCLYESTIIKKKDAIYFKYWEKKIIDLQLSLINSK